jgi:hypothetical protein
MTEASSRKPARLTKGSARAWGWVAGTIAFVLPWAAIGAKARSSAADATDQTVAQPRPVVIVRTITKRIVIEQQAPAASAPQVRYVTAGGGSSGGSSGGGGSAPAPPPPPPPASTGGS